MLYKAITVKEVDSLLSPDSVCQDRLGCGGHSRGRGNAGTISARHAGLILFIEEVMHVHYKRNSSGETIPTGFTSTEQSRAVTQDTEHALGVHFIYTLYCSNVC